MELKGILSGIIADTIKLGFNIAAANIASVKIETPPHIQPAPSGEKEQASQLEMEHQLLIAREALRKAKTVTNCGVCKKNIANAEKIINEDVMKTTKIIGVMNERNIKSWFDLDERTKEEIRKEAVERA